MRKEINTVVVPSFFKGLFESSKLGSKKNNRECDGVKKGNTTITIIAVKDFLISSYTSFYNIPTVCVCFPCMQLL